MHTKSYIRIFVITFISVILTMVPTIVSNHGLFLYAGDYYFQQIPFYTHASEVIANRSVGWDWYTDLGSDFIISYGFYLLGSIFFWGISWLPPYAIRYIMPLMIAFKTGIGAVGAYMYISRYVKDSKATFIGAYIYAFSGFQMVSLIYNHFHDVTALFPFLLLSFELLVTENKKCCFAFMVCIIALTNYFFFVGIVVFVILYYIVKCLKKEFAFSVRGLLSIAFESVIGIGCAAIILVPTFIVLSSAERVSDTLYGVNLISYDDNTIIPKILQSLFIMPDLPSNAMLFQSQDNTHNWASISLYLPLFTITGVVAYVAKNKQDWLSTVLKICFVMAIIPALNSVFSLFNSSYYARWYYMPVLLMSLATARSLEISYELKPGIKIAAVSLGILCLVSFLPDMVVTEDTEKLLTMIDAEKEPQKELKFFSLSPIPIVFWQCIAFAAVSLIIVYVFEHEKSKEKKIIDINKIEVILVAFVIISNIVFINNTVQELGFNRQDQMPYKLINEKTPEFNDTGEYRLNVINGEAYNNISMIWNKMNVSCFHSIVANEINDFFYNIQGDERRMLCEYREVDYPVYNLLSVKYVLNGSTGDELNVELKHTDLKGFSLYDKQGMYYIYKNDHFVPFGVTYDYCIDDSVLESYLCENVKADIKYQYKKMIMMRALVLDKKDIEKYKEYISPLPDSMFESLDEETYFFDCDERSAHACTSFEYDSKGYRAEIKVDKPSLVYFSVPCSNGWTAKVNGKGADVIKAHYGLTAVAVEKGENKIEFSYETPGLREGKKISLVSVIVLIVYTMIVMKNQHSEK